MDSQITSKINTLQRDLAELELREGTLLSELEMVQSKMKVIKAELAEITNNDKVANEILGRVYAQRRGSSDAKPRK